MKNLFIDSNVWLSLYHFTNDDLTQFEKLNKLIGKDIRLFIPQQVFDEVKRNRESKLKDALKNFELKSIMYPVFCKEYEEYECFSKDYSDLIRRFKRWRNKINTDMHNMSLPADNTINSFFDASGLLECNSLIDAAFNRYKIGNPPGKDNKYGDAINWECLLLNVPMNEDLYFISSDKDYCSIMSNERFNPFLEEEWKTKKNSNIYFYTNLVPFLKEHFDEIELKTEQEKQDLINRLNNSPSFESTHGIIAMMNKYSGWTNNQIDDICAAAINNTQVAWVLGDYDILDFYSQLLSKIDYGSLDDSPTKSVMSDVFSITSEMHAQEREDAKADEDEALEEYYKH